MVSNFVTYDLIFLALSIIFVVYFLYKRRDRIERQGILYLYKTQVGVKFIDKFAKKYSKILRPMQYLIVTIGYLLMAGIVYLFAWTIYIYLKAPASSALAKIPAVFPLIPYFPQLLNIESFFPPFYFTYFIIAIATVAIFHEFSHGIFMRLNNIKIKSTGFAFLGPFLGAFVEQDDKQMNKAKRFPQLSILAAGTFANVVLVILFALVFWLFFSLAFTPSGVYSTPAYDFVNTSQISSISNVSFGNTTYLEIVSNNQTYFGSLKAQPYIENKTYDFIPAYVSSPIFNAQVIGAITEFNGNKITSYSQLDKLIKSRTPGEVVNIKTIINDNVRSYNLALANKSGFADLGVYPQATAPQGVFRKIISMMNPGEDPEIYYKSELGSFGIFIKYLFWWIIFINFAVALSNMIPAGIFDGGHFFRISVEGITRRKKFAEYAFKFTTWLFVAALIVLMLKWVFNLI